MLEPRRLLSPLVLAVASVALAAASGCDAPRRASTDTTSRPAVARAQCSGNCWDGALVTVTFNSSLAAMLDVAGGAGAQRLAAFNQAVDDWNTALAAAGVAIRLAGADGGAYAADQNAMRCTDPPTGNPVYSQDYDGQDVHSGDGTNAASTAHDTMTPGLGDGWVVGDNPATWDIDGRLAETTCQIDDKATPAAGDDRITEADVLWFTHFMDGGMCPRIPWNYDHTIMPAGGRYDFYSVMLHELGHVLGLGHGGMGVMQATLPPNTRRAVGPWEQMQLAAIYGAGGACAGPGGDAGPVDAGPGWDAYGLDAQVEDAYPVFDAYVEPDAYVEDAYPVFDAYVEPDAYVEDAYPVFDAYPAPDAMPTPLMPDPRVK